MKKILLLCSILVVFLVSGYFAFFHEKKTDLTKVKVAEVTHSIFYAPQYVAHKLGYFKDEGLDVELILVSGADKVSAAVLSGDVNIGFCGSEASIYIYNQGEKDYLVNFAGLTKRDGSFIVSRKKHDNFDIKDLKGKYVIGGRAGGMPEMTFEWALKQNGIDPKKDLTIDTSIAFPAMGGAFISGIGDFVTLFEPNALQLEKEGLGYVVASVGEYGGVVPYTAYSSKKSYIEDNPDIIEGFSKGIQRGLDYVHSHSDEEVAQTILDYFPDSSLNDITKIVKRYRDIDSWFTTTYITEDNFNHVQNIAESAGELDKRAPYSKLVNTNFAQK
ncbi:MAG: ABC transporter substrate-binding protein [Bacilli bacterium]|nr:ABC transporter substrate-binding protein [Bacilli bacterium]MDD4733660.1 ABC transporter substrate-binding protein [Bacilli bacterium]